MSRAARAVPLEVSGDFFVFLGFNMAFSYGLVDFAVIFNVFFIFPPPLGFWRFGGDFW